MKEIIKKLKIKYWVGFYTVKIAGCSAMYTVANSGNYLHFSIVVHYKSVCNNEVLSVNYHFNSND